VRGQLDREVDGGGAVGAADDADGAGLLRGEAEGPGPDEGAGDPELRRSPEEERLGAREERAEVGERPEAEEDEGREDLEPHPLRQVVEEPADVLAVGRGGQPVLRQVGHERAEADGDEEQRLELAGDGQPEQQAGHRDHDELAPGRVGEARRLEQLRHGQAPCR
jgi:hypothetical protein